MRNSLLAAMVIITCNTAAQSNTASNIIEGGKTLVELVKVFKIPRLPMPQQNLVEKKDSCLLKGITDLCIRNSTVTPLSISLYKRNGNSYDAAFLSMKILARAQECLYELKAGIYKLKLETEEAGIKKLLQEGEIRLNTCENFFKEIKNQ